MIETQTPLEDVSECSDVTSLVIGTLTTEEDQTIGKLINTGLGFSVDPAVSKTINNTKVDKIPQHTESDQVDLTPSVSEIVNKETDDVGKTGKIDSVD